MPLYAGLDGNKQEFRLIRFVGGSRSLAWELKPFSIADKVAWVALSYCWGKAYATKSLKLNDEEFLVRPNLYSFLVQMASENRRNWFFVDAICINQSDDSEKGSQVALMGQIYRKAQEVIAWVYLEDNEDPRIMKQMDIEHALRHFQALKRQKTAEGQDLDPEERQTFTELVDMTRALVMSSDYWSRLWIVQEILLAKKLTIRWFSLTFEWSDILRLEIQGSSIPDIDLDKHGKPLRPHGTSTIRKANLFEYNALSGSSENSIMCKQLWYWSKSAGSDLQVGNLLPFHEAVEFFAIQNCSQLRDSVFGLLGISKTYIQLDLHVPIVELYAATLYNCLLSMWANPPEQHPSTSNLKNLQSLELDYTKLKSIGETLMHAFKLDPFQEVIFLISQEVCRRFMPGRQQIGQQALASSWLLHMEYIRYEVGAADNGLLKKKWYESEDRTLQRFHKDLERRSRDGLADLEKARATNKDAIAPGEDVPKRTYSEWVKFVHSMCDDIWARYQADVEALGHAS